MQKLVFLFCVCLCLYFTEANARYPFLKGSGFLNGNDSVFVIANVHEGRAHIEALNKKWDDYPKFLLSDAGPLIELEGQVSKNNSKIGEGCTADTVPSVGLSTSATGPFLYIGKKKDEIKWHPAKIIVAPKKSCVTPPKGYKFKEVTYYSLKPLNKRVFFAGWDRSNGKVTKEDSIIYVEQVGLMDADGSSCSVINRYERDFDWMNYKKEHSTRDFVGLLELGQSERWLIFKAAGHESQGYTAIPINLQGVVTDSDKIETVYASGC